MQFTPGLRLRSQVCSTEIIVVRQTSSDVDLRCGGVPMVPQDVEIEPGRSPLAGFDGGSPIGKRFVPSEGELFELLVTNSGDGALSVGETLLVTKDAKPLPSSD